MLLPSRWSLVATLETLAAGKATLWGSWSITLCATMSSWWNCDSWVYGSLHHRHFISALCCNSESRILELGDVWWIIYGVGQWDWDGATDSLSRNSRAFRWILLRTEWFELSRALILSWSVCNMSETRSVNQVMKWALETAIWRTLTIRASPVRNCFWTARNVNCKEGKRCIVVLRKQ